MNALNLSVIVERDLAADGQEPYRATLDDDRVEWGYGDTPELAVIEYFKHFSPGLVISESE